MRKLEQNCTDKNHCDWKDVFRVYVRKQQAYIDEMISDYPDSTFWKGVNLLILQIKGMHQGFVDSGINYNLSYEDFYMFQS